MIIMRRLAAQACCVMDHIQIQGAVSVEIKVFGELLQLRFARCQLEPAQTRAHLLHAQRARIVNVCFFEHMLAAPNKQGVKQGSRSDARTTGTTECRVEEEKT